MLFKGNKFIFLLVLIALLAILPISAADNVTADVAVESDCLASIETQNQDFSTVDVVGSDSAIDEGVLSGADSDDVYGVTYQRINTNIIANDLTQYAVDYNAGERGGNFYMLLVDQNGKALSNKTIKLGFNGVMRNLETDNDGWAHLQVNLAGSNKYTFAVTFLGDNTYNAVMKVYTINIVKKPTSISANAKTFKAKTKTKKYTVTLKTSKCSSINGKTYLSAGKKITLKLNGKTYSAKTNSKHQATFTLKITKIGKFNAVIKFAGDNTYKAASKTVKITIKK